jgi:hypothetical protein
VCGRTRDTHNFHRSGMHHNIQVAPSKRARCLPCPYQLRVAVSRLRAQPSLRARLELGSAGAAVSVTRCGARVRYKTCPFVQQRIRQLGESPHAAADKPKPVGAAADQGGVLGMGKWLLRKAAGVSDSNGGSERRAFPTLRFPVPN